MNIDQINQTLVRVFYKTLLSCGVFYLLGHLLSDLLGYLLGQGGDNPENIVLHQLRVGTGIGFYR